MGSRRYREIYGKRPSWYSLTVNSLPLAAHRRRLTRMVKKLMRLHARSILGAPRAVLDSELRLYPRCSGWTQERVVLYK